VTSIGTTRNSVTLRRPDTGVGFALQAALAAVDPVVPHQALALLEHHAVAHLGRGRVVELRAQLRGELRAFDQHAHLGIEIGGPRVDVHGA
jgi:hypothetical protein